MVLIAMMDYLIFALLIVILVILGLFHRKLERIDRNTWDLQLRQKELVDNDFRQVEALIGLYAELNLKGSLPETRMWAGSPDFLLSLARHIKELKPEAIVECSSGVSTLVAARMLQINGSGHVYSLENAKEFAENTKSELRNHGLSEWATVIHAPLVEIETELGVQRWYELRSLPDLQFDMVVVDGPPEFTNPFARFPAGPMLIPRLTEKGIVILDDADRADEKAIVEHWVKKFPNLEREHIACEKGMVVLRVCEPR